MKIDKFNMSSHKLWWHLDRLKDWIDGKRISPIHIDMGITTGCNIKCVYCYGMIMGRTNVGNRYDMPKEVLLPFLDDCAEVGVKSIMLSGEGENFLNPAIYDFCKHADRIGVDVGIATNGTLINKDRILDILRACTFIRFNISGANKNTYSKIHGVNLFDTVIENIKYCMSLKKEYNLDVTLGLQMVLLEENKNDIIPLAEIGKELGVDYLVIKPCSDTPNHKLASPLKWYPKLKSVYEKAELNSTDDYSVIIKHEKLLNEGINKFDTCYGTPFMIAINGRGDVSPCGHLFSYKKDRFHMGNITIQKFKDIINSDKYWDVQMGVRNLNPNKECETNCKQHSINNFLWELKHPPEHINFP